MKQVRFFDPKTPIDFVSMFKPAAFIGILIPVISIIGLLTISMNWGIDFSGGTEMQVKFSKPVNAENIRTLLHDLGFAKHQVQSFGAEQNNEMLVRVERISILNESDFDQVRGLIASELSAGASKEQVVVKLKTDVADRATVSLPIPTIAAGSETELNRALDEQKLKLAELLDSKGPYKLRRTKATATAAEDLTGAITREDVMQGRVTYNVQFIGIANKLEKAFSEKFGQVEVRRVEFVDSQVSKQLRTDGALAVLYAILAIVIYIAIRFDFMFAPGAIFGLINDTFGALMVFIFGRFEFDLPSVAALLTIVGYSINNTIVVYDRIRETLPTKQKTPLSVEEVGMCVNKAINDTMARSINTTLTTVLTTVALWMLAGGVVRSFALSLTVGMGLGAFSSTFLAPAAFMFMYKRFAKTAHETSTRVSGPTREEKARGIV